MVTRRQILAGGLLALVSGCAYRPAPGPPPHAPAYGRRRQLRWDPDLGVYAVVGLPGVYYLEPWYYRLGDDGWYISRDLNEWHGRPRNLPPGLAKKYGHGGPPRGRDRH